jgi:hypothetical protein
VISLLRGMQLREDALNDAFVSCVPSEGCREIHMQLLIIASEMQTILARIRETGRDIG